MEFGAHIALKYVIPFFLCVMVVEFFTARHLYHLKESASSLAIALVSTFVKVNDGAPAFTYKKCRA